jgi:hypothetical protein
MQDANEPAQALLDGLSDGAREANLIRLLTDSPKAPEVIVNYAEALAEMHSRIRLEALEAGRDPALEDLLRRITARQEVFPPPPDLGRRPLVPLILRSPAGELRFLTAIAHFGTSEDVTVRDLRLELLHPMDEKTKNAMGGG